MSGTLKEIARIKGEMDKLVSLALKRHPVLSDSRYYRKMLKLNGQLELLYRELAHSEPTLYRSMMIANAIRSDIISHVYFEDDTEDCQGGTA